MTDPSAGPAPALPDALMRTEARRVYGEDPLGYEAGRSDHPERVFELLASRCGLRSGATVLEIGPGTGRVTRHLVEVGARVLAIEPDPSLARHLRESLDPTAVEVLEAGFEDAPVQEGHHDLAVAAMSFHWVDQAVGLPKLGRILHPGGWAALWWTLFGYPFAPAVATIATLLLAAPVSAGPPIDLPNLRIEYRYGPPFDGGGRWRFARGAVQFPASYPASALAADTLPEILALIGPDLPSTDAPGMESPASTTGWVAVVIGFLGALAFALRRRQHAPAR